jgi:2-polyprenyl-3-methyl-5-hydroxy-6-metoxy-1,4-benzoquinol methylase
MSDQVNSSQEFFETCYRGRQSALHHAAYMRMSKVLLTLDVCRRAGISLENCRVMDYGFGAGTFFRYCAPSCLVAGVEIDPVNVRDVREMLRERGYPRVELETIEIERWSEHPLLRREYDLFLCSHVLEHLATPADFLRTVKASLGPNGKFVGLVPINERRPDLHHLQTACRERVHEWAGEAGMHVAYYVENDHFLFWPQPWLIHETGLAYKAGRAVSLALGLPATLLGPRPWFAMSQAFSVVTHSKPTQAAFVLEPLTH